MDYNEKTEFIRFLCLNDSKLRTGQNNQIGVTKMKWICTSPRIGNFLVSCIAIGLAICQSGCSPTVSGSEQLRRFDRIGAIMQLQEEAAENRFEHSYRVSPGDVLEFSIPPVLYELSNNYLKWGEKAQPFLCRVTQEGHIVMPIAGTIPAAGMTTDQIEATVISAHYPKYVNKVPPVVCKVSEHRTDRMFSVVGLVREPGTFEYPPNAQYTLTDAIAMAKGAHIAADPHFATIYRQDGKGQVTSVTAKINGKNMVLASDILIQPGDVISVDRTMRTEMNLFLDKLLHFSVGTSVPVSN